MSLCVTRNNEAEGDGGALHVALKKCARLEESRNLQSRGVIINSLKQLDPDLRTYNLLSAACF